MKSRFLSFPCQMRVTQQSPDQSRRGPSISKTGHTMACVISWLATWARMTWKPSASCYAMQSDYFDFFPRYRPAMPKVYGVQVASAKPAALMRSIICRGAGKRSTDEGRYV